MGNIKILHISAKQRFSCCFESVKKEYVLLKILRCVTPLVHYDDNKVFLD